jgi:hypothetical protein
MKKKLTVQVVDMVQSRPVIRTIQMKPNTKGSVPKINNCKHCGREECVCCDADVSADMGAKG